MGPTRPILAILSLILVAGGVLLQFFTILSGAVNSGPESHFYFLQTSTNGIPNARNPSRWTYFAVCGVDPTTGHNANCGSTVPALPFDPVKNFGTTTNVPGDFVHHSGYYYLMSRFAWVFWLIALVFGSIALITGLLAMFSRLGGYISSLTTFIALFFQTLATILQTVWVIKGRDNFRRAGFQAKVGTDLMAFAWTILVCFFLAAVMFCLGGRLGGDRDGTVRRKRSTKSTRSRGSFIDGESQRKMREYSP